MTGACDIRLRAERKAGKLLREMEKAKGSPGNQHTGKVDRRPGGTGPKYLGELGITKKQSANWQKLAEVEPRLHMIDGANAKAHIVSANLARRNLKKGQRAMALAMIYPDTSPGKRTKGSATTLSQSNKVSTARLSQARAVLRHSGGDDLSGS